MAEEMLLTDLQMEDLFVPDSIHKLRYSYPNSSDDSCEVYLAPCGQFRGLPDLLPHAYNTMEVLRTLDFRDEEQAFDICRRTFQGALNMEFGKEYDAIPAGQVLDLDTLEALLKRMIAAYAVQEDQAGFVQYLHKVKKTKKFPAAVWLTLFQRANTMIEWFPGLLKSMDDEALKWAYFNSFPAKFG
jgi:hypothetical protein